ncbi:unnamed protein product [Pleuronectes platessa]|uniref:Uncharacterized protein n=1 Tax=Pleuronectes platessa TaxID=8262 RepID=A0A9N7TRF1_PLEPL|nr:unnamed protein product [Pleuronectes platessa]
MVEVVRKTPDPVRPPRPPRAPPEPPSALLSGSGSSSRFQLCVFVFVRLNGFSRELKTTHPTARPQATYTYHSSQLEVKGHGYFLEAAHTNADLEEDHSSDLQQEDRKAQLLPESVPATSPCRCRLRRRRSHFENKGLSGVAVLPQAASPPGK